MILDIFKTNPKLYKDSLYINKTIYISDVMSNTNSNLQNYINEKNYKKCKKNKMQ